MYGLGDGDQVDGIVGADQGDEFVLGEGEWGVEVFDFGVGWGAAELGLADVGGDDVGVVIGEG